jgi:two-component system response regulator HydG
MIFRLGAIIRSCRWTAPPWCRPCSSRELFGHVKGAFTGAEANKIGKFELSTGGSLFLDEVGNISLEIQAKLLKAVEERTICKVGSNRVIRVDTRLVAATNQDLARSVRDGTFREDLFYRLNVMEVHLPPLRQRPEDIPPMVDQFMEMYRGMSSVRVRGFHGPGPGTAGRL